MEEITSLIVQKLIQSGYSEKKAQSLGERLNASDKIREQLLVWIETNEESDCVYDNISALALMRERGFTYPAALSTIAWLYRDPQAAHKMLSSRVDYIVGGTT